jgi:hypothetical protein
VTRKAGYRFQARQCFIDFREVIISQLTAIHPPIPMDEFMGRGRSHTHGRVGINASSGIDIRTKDNFCDLVPIFVWPDSKARSTPSLVSDGRIACEANKRRRDSPNLSFIQWVSVPTSKQ